MIYTAAASRQTPEELIPVMEGLAEQLAKMKWNMRSGYREGMDTHFTIGAAMGNGAKELYIPWQSFNTGMHKRNDVRVCHCLDKHLEAIDIASRFYPNWKTVGDAVQMYLVRNVFMLTGEKINEPSDMLVCWSLPQGSLTVTSEVVRMAEYLGIPVFNLIDPETDAKLEQFVLSKTS